MIDTIQTRLRAFQFDKDNMPRMASETRVPVGLASEAADTIDTLEAEIKRLWEALERLGSLEAMTTPFYNNAKSRSGQELNARIDFARSALAAKGGVDE